MHWPTDIQMICISVVVFGIWIGRTLDDISKTLGAINSHVYSIKVDLEHLRYGDR